MTGNVDEWTRSARSTGFSSILKGGYWGPVRARCRPATRAHNEDFIAYQQGFRCCGDADASVHAPRPQVSTTTQLASRAAPSAPSAPAGPAADLSTEWDHRASDDADEVESIGRARVGLTCSAAPPAGARGSVPAPGALAPAVALAVAALARRRARRPC